jgi:hypothetical protein
VDSNETPASGSRWEPPPTAGEPPAWSAQPVTGAPADVPLADPAPAAGGRGSRPLMKSRLALMAGAVGLVAVGGVGGFVLGQSSSATASTGDSGHVGGTPPWMKGGEGGFPGQRPGGPLSGGTRPRAGHGTAPDGSGQATTGTLPGQGSSGDGSMTGSDPTT